MAKSRTIKKRVKIRCDNCGFVAEVDPSFSESLPIDCWKCGAGLLRKING